MYTALLYDLTKKLKWKQIIQNSEKLIQEIFNASENSFGVASVVISGKSDSVLFVPEDYITEGDKAKQA